MGKKKKEKRYVIVHQIEEDSGSVVRMATGDEIRERIKTGELLSEGTTIVDGKILKGESQNFDFTRLK